MARTGRPPLLTEAVLRERIAAYCARYNVSALNAEGFPAYPSGFRETPRHRQWVALYKAFSRVRARGRAAEGPASGETQGLCPICLRGANRPNGTHRQCVGVVKFVREVGENVLDRIRAEAFPDDVGSAGSRGVKRKT